MRWLAVALILAPALARAGNDDDVLLGNDAAMTGGAVTAMASDGAAAYYNPAGIAAVERNSVDVNGQAFVLRIAVVPGLLRSSSGTEADGGYVDITSIPSALTLVRNLGCGVNLGFGVFVPHLSQHTDRVSLDEPLGDGSTTHWQLAESNDASQYRVGGTLGFRVLPNLRFGFGVFAVYDQYTGAASFFGGTVGPDGTPLEGSGLSGLSSLQSLGGLVNAGVQWAPIPEIRLGLSVTSPGISFGWRYRTTFAGITATSGGPLDFGASDMGDLQPQVELVLPARVRGGIAYVWDRGWIALDGDVQHPIDRPEVGVVREFVFGVRIGGRVRLDETISLGGGLFTDLSPNRSPQAYGQTRIDFFGGTFGLEIRSPHRLGEGESAGTIEFVTAVSIRYALGIGQIGGLAFDTNTASVALVDTVINEIGLQLGSGLYF